MWRMTWRASFGRPTAGSSPAAVAPITSHFTATTTRKYTSEYTKRITQGDTHVNTIVSDNPVNPPLCSKALHIASN